MEKKKIGYNVLVVILFAVVCFLTVYILVKRTAGDDCATSDNLSTIAEDKLYSYSSVAGSYKVEVPVSIADLPNFDSVYYSLYLSEDGTFSYHFALTAGSSILGNYVIRDNKVVLNYLLIGGSDSSFSPIDGQNIIEIGDNYLVDNDARFSDETVISTIKLIKQNDEGQSYKDFFKNALEDGYLYNNTNNAND